MQITLILAVDDFRHLLLPALEFLAGIDLLPQRKLSFQWVAGGRCGSDP